MPSRLSPRQRHVLGTPGYMAPEQASPTQALTPSADIFSLGCVLYECLPGSLPSARPTSWPRWPRILFTEPEPLRALRPELPGSLQELLQRMLAKQPRAAAPDGQRCCGPGRAAGSPALPPPGRAPPPTPRAAPVPSSTW